MESEVYVCNFIFSFVTHTHGQCQRFHAMAFLGHFSCIYLHFHAAFSCSPPDPDPPNRLASRSRNCARSPAASLTSHPPPMPSWPSAVAAPRAGPQDAAHRDRVFAFLRYSAYSFGISCGGFSIVIERKYETAHTGVEPRTFSFFVGPVTPKVHCSHSTHPRYPRVLSQMSIYRA